MLAAAGAAVRYPHLFYHDYDDDYGQQNGRKLNQFYLENEKLFHIFFANANIDISSLGKANTFVIELQQGNVCM